MNDKEAANFCDWFRPNEAAGPAGSGWTTKRDSARESFDKLFGQ